MGKTVDSTARGRSGSGHDSGLCGAAKKTGGLCARPAGWGTPHPGRGKCKLHGGSTRNHVAGAQREEAKEAVALYGLPTEIDPHEALLEELRRTVGHVRWLERVIRAGRLEKGESPTGKARVVKLDQATFAAGDQPSVWMELYHHERKHLRDIAKTCIDVGIEERRVRLAEQAGEELAELIRGVLTDLGVPLSDPKTREVVTRRLTLLEGGQAA